MLRPKRPIAWLPASPYSRAMRSRIEKLRQMWWMPKLVLPPGKGTMAESS